MNAFITGDRQFIINHGKLIWSEYRRIYTLISEKSCHSEERKIEEIISIICLKIKFVIIIYDLENIYIVICHLRVCNFIFTILLLQFIDSNNSFRSILFKTFKENSLKCKIYFTLFPSLVVNRFRLISFYLAN